MLNPKWSIKRMKEKRNKIERGEEGKKERKKAGKKDRDKKRTREKKWQRKKFWWPLCNHLRWLQQNCQEKQNNAILWASLESFSTVFYFSSFLYNFLKVLFWGLRNLQSQFWTSVNQPQITIRCADKEITSPVIENPSIHPNFQHQQTTNKFDVVGNNVMLNFQQLSIERNKKQPHYVM